MPQLDIVTFFSQFFWFLILYVSFYYVLYKYFLPQYSRCILFRDKFTGSSMEESNIYLEEKKTIEESLSNITTSAVSFSKKSFKNSQTGTLMMHNLWNKKTNDKNKAANLLYIKTFGGRKVSKNLSNNSISYTVGSLLYTEGLSQFCTFYGQKVEKRGKILNKESFKAVETKEKTLSNSFPFSSESTKTYNNAQISDKELSKNSLKVSRQKISGKKSLNISSSKKK